MTLAENLERWRDRHAISFATVASVAGVTEQTVRNWENGDGQPRADHLTRLEAQWPGFCRAIGIVQERRA